MAHRPVFLPGRHLEALTATVSANFTWSAGLSLSQKRKSIASLHGAILSAGLAHSPLEISTKSAQPLGVELSAFRLRFLHAGWPECSVEAAFQSSKVFADAGPFTDIINLPPREAKRDPRLTSSGRLIAFEFRGERWPLVPPTLFYDWLYVNALLQNAPLAAAVVAHDAFTDIEFNPDRSVNCQARSAASYVAMTAIGLADQAGSPGTLRQVLLVGSGAR